MKLIVSFVLALMTVQICSAQDFRVTPSKKRGNSYSHEKSPFPAGIMVYTTKKEKLELSIDSLTLIQVWSTCCGAEPEVWSQARAMERRYKDQGLKTLTINFENGSDFESQFEEVLAFLGKVTQPEHAYLDTMGYVIDYLKVPGFPTYYLVNGEGTVVFRTSGKDPEGLSILETEIQNRLGS